MEQLTLDGAIGHLNDVLENKRWDCEECKNDHIALKGYLEELKQYRDAEKSGLMVHLPCKVGDTVWVNSQTLPSSVNTWCYTKTLEYEELPMFFEARVVSIKCARHKTLKLAIKANCFCRSEYGNCEYTKVIEYCNKSYPFSAVGKTVFLTREEVEKALKERENNE